MRWRESSECVSMSMSMSMRVMEPRIMIVGIMK